MDPKYNQGDYEPKDGPFEGMATARKIGTICYRSRGEFDSRFDWSPDDKHAFEVEKYLTHQGEMFRERYDANCYLLMSKCMDLMDIGVNHKGGMEEALDGVPDEKEFMLLPFASDSLIPAMEMVKLGGMIGKQGKRVHMEQLESINGHDAFLIESCLTQSLNPRLRAFLDPEQASGVDAVRQYLRGCVGW
jgi:homoserine O-acetyltransferase